MIARGIAEHESVALSFIDGKILVTKANFFQKIWSHWTNFLVDEQVNGTT